MKFIRVLERKYIPNLRHKQLYKAIKITLLTPILLPIYLIKLGLKEVIGLIKIKRRGKPDIVLSNIIAGWSNLAFTDPAVESLAIERAAICAKCPFAEMSTGLHTIVVDNKTTQVRGLKCGKCGCPLSAKVRTPMDGCPIGRW
jgi:hypothetical protein